MIKNTNGYYQIGINLKNIRLRRRQTQMDFGAITEYSRQYIGKIETGKARVTFNLLCKLVRGLEITLEELISNDDMYSGNLGYILEGGVKNV